MYLRNLIPVAIAGALLVGFVNYRLSQGIPFPWPPTSACVNGFLDGYVCQRAYLMDDQLRNETLRACNKQDRSKGRTQTEHTNCTNAYQAGFYLKFGGRK